MKRGLSAKVLFIPGIIILLTLVFFIGGKFFINISEYKKDQKHLAVSFKTKLPQIPKAEIKYPVKSYLITTGGFCWLMTGAGIANYLEPDIDLDDFVLYARPTLFMANRTENERYGPGLNHLHAFSNLGYTVYRGSTNPEHPPPNLYPDIGPENFIYFKDKNEELLFAKKLLLTGIIPIIHVGGDFLALTGYDNQGAWLGSPEVAEEEKPKDYLKTAVVTETWFMPYDRFFQSWAGDNQFFWMEKTGKRKTEEEIFAENKKNALEAPENILKTIDFLKQAGNALLYTHEFDTPSAVALYRYFSKKGSQKLANKYLEIAKVYNDKRESLGPSPPQRLDKDFLIQLLTKLYPLYQQTTALWP